MSSFGRDFVVGHSSEFGLYFVGSEEPSEFKASHVITWSEFVVSK